MRENISGRFKEWNDEFETFEGTSADMIKYCMNVWWERVGATKASGITKLMVSEARNFPEITAFYQQEVVEPAQQLIRRMLQRGMERGEFRVADLDYAVYSVIAPMVFLIMSKHSLGACVPQDKAISPERYIASQVDIMLNGLSIVPETKKAGGKS